MGAASQPAILGEVVLIVDQAIRAFRTKFSTSAVLNRTIRALTLCRAIRPESAQRNNVLALTPMREASGFALENVGGGVVVVVFFTAVLGTAGNE